MALLEVGRELVTSTADKVVVGRLLGSGGQGEVYEVVWKGQSAALKWYHQQSATPQQLKNLQTLAGTAPPNDRFLWPLAILEAQGDPVGFGYVMPLRGPQYRGIIDWMSGRSAASLRTLATAGFLLAECYLKLHSAGLCYCDINFGNVFWDDSTGEVKICDNDNVIPNGEPPAVAGTIGFMAPEVTTGAASPSLETDKHSLAVLLFYMLTKHHPLKGLREERVRALDLPARVELYGRNPLFIFHPTDESNRPDQKWHTTVMAWWPIYPRFLQELFVKAFTGGLTNPGLRVTESEWMAALVRLRDSIVPCRDCSAENFYDSDRLRQSGGVAPTCWSCRKPLALPFRIRIGQRVVMLNADAKLFPHHVDPQRAWDFSAPVADLSTDPRDPKRVGLRNLSATKWTFTAVGSAAKDVPPGRSLPVADGAKVNFGPSEGEIRS